MLARRPAGARTRSSAASTSQPWVKTSLAPGSRVVTDYLERAGLLDLPRRAALQPRRLRLHDLHRQLRAAARRVAQRGRASTTWSSSPCSRATATSRAASTRRCARSYLASPPLVVAYALAGTIDIDLDHGAARHRPRRRARLPARPLAVAGGDRRRSSTRAVTADLFETEYADDLRTATSTGGAWTRRRASCSRGTRTRRTSASRRSSPTSAPSRRR